MSTRPAIPATTKDLQELKDKLDKCVGILKRFEITKTREESAQELFTACLDVFDDLPSEFKTEELQALAYKVNDWQFGPRTR